MLRSRLGWPQQRPWVEHSRPHTQSQSTETKPPFTSALLSSSPFSFLSLTPTPTPIPGPTPSVSRPLISYPNPLLPVPLARSRLLESLGAVTMCCFVDDDIICEGYSGGWVVMVQCDMVWCGEQYLPFFVLERCNGGVDVQIRLCTPHPPSCSLLPPRPPSLTPPPSLSLSSPQPTHHLRQLHFALHHISCNISIFLTTSLYLLHLLYLFPHAVTEEIFLLKGDGETSKENVSNTSAAQKQSHKEHSGSAPAEGSSVAVTPPAAKSVVLDLHANPEVLKKASLLSYQIILFLLSIRSLHSIPFNRFYLFVYLFNYLFIYLFTYVFQLNPSSALLSSLPPRCLTFAHSFNDLPLARPCPLISSLTSFTQRFLSEPLSPTAILA